MRNLIFSEPVENLNDLHSIFSYKIPPPAIRACIHILNFFKKKLGVSFAVIIPDSLAKFSGDTWQIIKKLEIARRFNIISNAYRGGFYDLYPDEPRLFSWTIILGKEKIRGHGGFGYDFFSYEKAVGPALGEGVERWALSSFNPDEKDKKIASFSEIERENAIDPFTAVGYTNDFRTKKHPRFDVSLKKDSVFSWVRGESLITKKKIWIPSQIVSFSGQERLYAQKEPLILKLVSTGAAAHNTLPEALLNGLLEVIQRDAFMIYWVSKTTPVRLSLKEMNDERIRYIEKVFERYHLKVHVLYLRTDVPVHTVLAVVLDESGVGPALAVGAHSGFEIIETTYKAVLEAFASRLSIRQMMDEYKKEGKSFEFLHLDTLGHEERLIYWASSQKKVGQASFLWEGKEIKLQDVPVYKIQKNSQLSYLIDFFTQEKKEVSFVRLLKKDMEKKLSMSAVTVYVPHLQPLHLEEDVPCFGGERIFSIPKKIGLSNKGVINTVPHPFP